MPGRPTPSPQERIAAFVAAGFSVSDAERWVRESDAMLPPGADPYSWVPDPDEFAASAVIDEAAIRDAQDDWHEHAPREFKSLLDAKPAGSARRKRTRAVQPGKRQSNRTEKTA